MWPELRGSIEAAELRGSTGIEAAGIWKDFILSGKIREHVIFLFKI